MAWMMSAAALSARIALSALLRVTLGEEVVGLFHLEEVLRSLLEGLFGRAEGRRRLQEALRRAEARYQEKETDPILRQALAMFSMADLPSVEEAVKAWRAYPDPEAVRAALRQALRQAAPQLPEAALEAAVNRYLEEVERALLEERGFLGPILLERLGRIETLVGDLAERQAEVLALARELREALREAPRRAPEGAELRPLMEELAVALNRLHQELALREARREPAPAAPAPAEEGVPDPEGVVWMAAVTDQGELRPVGGLAEKLHAVAEAFPPVHTVVVAEAQEGVPPEREPPWSVPWVVRAPTVREALRRIAARAAERWGEIPDYEAVRRRHPRLVGRRWLDARVEEIRQEAAAEGRYLLLIAPAGFGKTAYVVHRTRRDPGAAVHFFRPEGDLDRLQRMAGSLEAQLRRRWGLPRRPGEESLEPEERLRRVLEEAGRRARARGVVQEVWIDALDEAEEPEAVARWLPREAPPGVLIGLTSRPGRHLDGWGEPRARRLDWTEEAVPLQREDLEAYLRMINEEEGLGLPPDLVARLVEAAEGSFLAAVMYGRSLRERPGLRAEWAAHPEAIPRGLDGYLQEEWDRLRRAARAARVEWERVEWALGLLTALREPLSLEDLRDLLREAGEKEAAAGLEALPGVLPWIARWLERAVDSRRTPIRWFHSRFREFIAERLQWADPRAVHRALGRACDRWAALPAGSRARAYATRHRLRHYALAGEWEGVWRGLLEAAYQGERVRMGDGLGLAADGEAALSGATGEPAEDIRAAVAFIRRRANWWETLGAWWEWEAWDELRPALSARGREAMAEGLRGALREGWWKAAGPAALRTGAALGGHMGPVTSVVFSPDGRWVASGSGDRTVRLWEVSSGRCAWVGEGHTDWVHSVAFSPDGRWVASGSDDRTVRVWEAASGRCAWVGEGHTRFVMGIVTSVAFSPDGRWVASGSYDHTVRLWEAASGRCAWVGEGHTGYVRSVVFSPDGRWVASGSDDRTVRVWEVSSGRCAWVGKGHTNEVTSVVFSPDGRWVASGSRDHTVRVWEASSGRCAWVGKGHTNEVTSVVFSPDGRWVASGSYDHTVRLWEAASGRCAWVGEGHTEPVTSVVFSPDGRWVASGSRDGTVRVWEASSGRCAWVGEGHTEPVTSVVFSPDGRWVASGSRDGTVRVWEASSGRCAWVGEGHTWVVTSVAFSPDGRWAASGSNDGTVRLWEVSSGRCAWVGKGHTNEVTSVVFSPDGRWVASGSNDGTVRVWEAASGRCAWVRKGHTWVVTSVVFSPDGRWVASRSVDGTVRVWEVASGRCAWVGEEHTYWVNSVAFSPDGRWVASGRWDGTVRVWEVSSGRCAWVGEGHTLPVTSVAFSPDGRWVASGSNDGTVRLWEVSSGRCAWVGEGHTEPVTSVVFSPDGRWVASRSVDRTVRVWEVSSGRCAWVGEGHTEPVTSVAFSPDGRWVASGSSDRTVRVWEVSSGRPGRVLAYDAAPAGVGFARDGRLQVMTEDGRLFVYRYGDPLAPLREETQPSEGRPRRPPRKGARCRADR